VGQKPGLEACPACPCWVHCPSQIVFCNSAAVMSLRILSVHCSAVTVVVFPPCQAPQQSWCCHGLGRPPLRGLYCFRIVSVTGRAGHGEFFAASPADPFTVGSCCRPKHWTGCRPVRPPAGFTVFCHSGAAPGPFIRRCYHCESESL
jgi:hypothetical protein